MIKVLIVEDNALIRQSIIQTINWNSLGCEVIGEAGDGLEALNLAKEILPDLIITDIKMPEMDGLELAERIKCHIPWVKVIIITGYDEFSYAQRAVKLGAFDLILKPIDNEELNNVIRKVVKEFEKEREDQAEKQKMIEERKSLQSEISKSTLELRKKFLIDVIVGLSLKDENTEEKLHHLGLAFTKHVVFIIKPDIINDKIKDMQESYIPKFVKCSEDAMERVKKIYKFEFIYFWLNYGFTVIAIPNKVENNKAVNIKMMEVCAYITELLQKATDLKFAIGISNVYSGIKEIERAFNEAQSALDCRFFIDNKLIIHAGSLQSKSILNENPLMKKINVIYEYLRNGEEGFESLLGEIFNEIRENENSDARYVKNLLIDICMTAKRIVYEKSNYGLQRLKSSAEIHADINSFCSISQAFMYVKEFILQIFDVVNVKPGNNYSQVTQKILNYLNENYNRKVSLQEIADIVSLSPAHLSRIIKKDTGESYIDLFNNIKIDVSVKLLKNTNLKVYEVANSVGIENYAYFYQLFKKVTGTSPTEYNNS